MRSRDGKKQVRVWDMPTRVFHWLLVISIVGAFVSALYENLLDYHVLFGKAAFVSGLFRLAWGLVGGRFSRFAHMLARPGRTLDYLRQVAAGQAPRTLGHNPAASWVMLAMIVLPVMIGLTGLIALSGQEAVSPAASWFSLEQGRLSAGLHLGLAIAMLVLILAHLAGLALHTRLHKENIAASMIHGQKQTTGEAYGLPEPVGAWMKSGRRLALAGTLAAALLVFLGLPFTFHNPATLKGLAEAGLKEQPGRWLPEASAAITVTDTGSEPASSVEPSEALWRKECGACHFAFHPSSLPAVSWKKMMGELYDHFGEVASLDEDSEQQLLAYALSHPAEAYASEASVNLLDSVKPGGAPQQITRLSYWVNKHEDIDADVFARKTVKKNHNCGACHAYALHGSFEDVHIDIPR